jgi:hypothetical protein
MGYDKISRLIMRKADYLGLGISIDRQRTRNSCLNSGMLIISCNFIWESGHKEFMVRRLDDMPVATINCVRLYEVDAKMT